MTNKQLKQKLLDAGWELEKESYYSNDGSHTKITNEFYISGNDECVKFSKIGRGKERITLFTGWEYNYAQCGHIVKSFALPDDIIAFMKDSEEFEMKLKREAKEIVNSIDSYYDNDYVLPWC